MNILGSETSEYLLNLSRTMFDIPLLPDFDTVYHPKSYQKLGVWLSYTLLCSKFLSGGMPVDMGGYSSKTFYCRRNCEHNNVW